jgi:WD40 repeat protein
LTGARWWPAGEPTSSPQVLSSPPDEVAAEGLHADLATPEERRYRPLHLLGRGGMGRVVAVHDLRLSREVAVKSLSPDCADPETLDVQLAREARIAASLDHPGIVPILDAGVGVDGRVYYTMPIVRGQTLAEALVKSASREARMRLLRRVLEACEAVGWAHGQGVVHRDLKPSNIMLGEGGGTRVLDWGLAATQDGGGRGVVGTPAYMSPEQSRGAPSDARADVWSLGAVLYEVCAGHPLRQGEGRDGALESDIDGRFWHIRPGDELPAELLAIISRCLATSPDARYPDAMALARDLANHLEGRRVVAHDYSARELFVRLVRAWKVPLLVALIAMVCLIVIVAVGLDRLQTEAETASQARDDALVAEARAAAASEKATLDLARSQVTQAILESTRGSRQEAERLAVNALERLESPEARGVLARWGTSPPPTLFAHATSPPCLNYHLDDTGHRVFCREPEALSAWHLAGDTLILDWRRDLRVTGLVASREALHVVSRDALVALEPATGRTLGTFASSCGPRLKSVAGEIIAHDNVCLAAHRPLRVARPCGSWLGAVVPGPDVDTWTAICEDGDLILGAFGVPERDWRLVHTTLRTPGNALTAAALGDKVVVGTADGELVVIDSSTGESVARFATGFSKIVEVVAAERLVAVRSATGAVAVFEPEEGLTRANLGEIRARDMTMRGDELTIVGHEIRKYRIALGTPGEFRLNSGVTSVAFDASGDYIAASSGDRIEIRQVVDGTRVARLEGDGDFIKSASFDGAGDLVAIASAVREGGRPRLMRWARGASGAWLRDRLEDRHVTGRRIVSLASGMMLVSSYRRGIDGIAPGDAELSAVVPATQRFSDLQVAHGGRFAVAIGEDDGAVWRIASSPLSAVLVTYRAGLDRGAVSLDGAWVAHAGGERIEVLDGETGAVLAVVERPEIRFTTVAFSADLRWLAAGSSDGVVWVFAMPDLRLVATSRRHGEGVFSAAFSPDSRLLATGSWDGRVSFHDLTRLDKPAEALGRDLGLHR